MDRVFLELLGVNPKRVGGIEIHLKALTSRLSERGFRSILCTYQEPSPEVRQFLDAPYVQWEVIPGIYANHLGVLPAIVRMFARYRPEWVHIQMVQCLSFYPWVAACFGARKIIFIDQASRPEKEGTQATPGWKRLLARLITVPYHRIIAVSDFNLRSLRTTGFFPSRVLHRIYNSVDLAHADRPYDTKLRERYGIAEERILVVQVASLIAEKGPEDLLEAARAVLARDPNFHFLLVGDGPSGAMERYQALAGQLGIAEAVTFTGLVTDPAAGGIYAAADICCQVSRWQEAFGWVITEAMAASKPVIATRVGGIPEIVEDGVTGFLVPSRNPGALTDRLLQLAHDAALRRRLGAAGREKVERVFNLNETVEELLNCYDAP